MGSSNDARLVLMGWLPPAAMAAGAALVALATLGPVWGQSVPEPAQQQIQFARDIKPILQSNCRRCHATSHKKNPKGGFNIDTRETILNGGDSGPAVKPGHSADSRLIEMVTGPDPEMPRKGGRLTNQEVALLRAWIDQDLPWKEGFSFADRQPVDVAPHNPELPEAPDAVSDNPIDRMLAAYFKKHEVAPTQRVDDRTYIRRVSRDLLGLLPTPARVERFVQSEAPNKRQKLVEQMLNRNKAYATHWLSFWNDRLRNAYRGPGYIDGGRQQITKWLYEALYHNKPYDTFVQQLIDPVKGSEGFVKGIKWRGVVNASQRRELQVARTVSQVFLGTRLKCASCHDSFVDRWQLEDVYGLANVFAEKPLEMYRCDTPTGRTVKPRMIFPQLGEIDADAPVEKRRRQLATLLTSKRNGRFARTIVNQLWAELMGRGIISPTRNMANPPWHGDLLDWLASDLVEHDYNLKHTLKVILTSRAYQMPAVRLEEPNPSHYVFRGPLVKRMSAEQFVDAVSRVTGVWQKKTGGMTGGGSRGGQLSALKAVWQQARKGATEAKSIEAHWIWDKPAKSASSTEASRNSTDQTRPQTLHFRTQVDIPRDHHHARAVVTAANAFTVYVNGQKVAEHDDWPRPVGLDLSSQLEPGRNTIAIEARHTKGPGGLVFYAFGLIDGEPVWRVQSDDTWRVSRSAGEGWTSPGFDDSGWDEATRLGSVQDAPRDVKPAQFAKALKQGLSVHPEQTLRAAVAFRDSLMDALGRPNRSQVMMERNARASMLQAMELTNGKTLNQMVKTGAKRLLKEAKANGKVEPAHLTRRIWRRALNRKPTDQELAVTRELLGEDPGAAKVADLIWAVTMLPEFQLIR